MKAARKLGTTKTTDTRRRTKPRFSAATRFAAASAERHLDADSPTDWDTDPSEIDDAPPAADVPIGYHDDEDGAVYDEDGEDSDLSAPRSSWVPWVRLSIYLRDGQLMYLTELPGSDQPDLARSLFHLDRGWGTTAQTLIDTQGDALRCSTPLAALHALNPFPMSSLERSAGQGSRDRRVVVNTPFGLTPLWFFAQGRGDSLFGDLERLGRALIARQESRLSPELVTDVVRTPSVKPDSIRRAHGRALLAVAHQPAVVARHRAKWPLTTPDDLLDDLGVVARVGRSSAVASLALAGAFDPPELLIASSARSEPRREAT